MNDGDLGRIEQELGIELPKQYRKFMLGLDSAELRGNADSYIWDNAEAIIQRNLELRDPDCMKPLRPWPPHMLFVGDPLTACGYAIDLAAPDLPVHWVDHCDLDVPSSGSVAPSFIQWAEDYVNEVG